jgi:DNA-binding transcriptional MerR regulator
MAPAGRSAAAVDRKLEAPFSGLEAFSAEDGPNKPYGRGDLTIGEMSRAFGLTLRALRFYENKGLLSPRRQGAARFYGRADRDRLPLVLNAKRLGFTLDEIRQMLASPGEPAEAGALDISRRQCFDQIKFLEHRKREIEAALAELRHIYSSFYARIVEATGRNSA